MAVLVNKRKDARNASRSSDGYKMDEEWLIEDATGSINTPEEALDVSGLPNLGDSHTTKPMVVTNLSAKGIPDDDTRWIVTVTYSRQKTADGAAAGGAVSSISFDTGQATIHKIQANVPTPASKSFAKTGTAPLSQGLIGWDGEKAQGVDIEGGAFMFSLSRRYTVDQITEAYVLSLSRNAMKINNAAWGLWDAGEVLYRGAQARHTSGGRTFFSGDDASQFSSPEGITGVNSTNSDNGILYLKMTKMPGLANYTINIYKDSALTDLVAQDSFASVGNGISLAGAGGSGISGEFDFDSYEYDTDQITINFPFPWEITYNFSISENEASIDLGGITVTDKKGWEYADVQYSPEEQTVDSKVRVIQTAEYVYLHEVYPEADLSSLLLIDDATIIPS